MSGLRTVSTCPHCGATARVDIVERTATTPASGVEPASVMRIMRTCVNERCSVYDKSVPSGGGR